MTTDISHRIHRAHSPQRTMSLTLNNGLCQFVEVLTDTPAEIDVLVETRRGLAPGSEVELGAQRGWRRAAVASIHSWGAGHRVRLEVLEDVEVSAV